MKKIIIAFFFIAMVLGFVSAQTTMSDPPKPASVAVGGTIVAQPVSPLSQKTEKVEVKAVPKEKVSVDFFLDDGTVDGLKASPKDFTLYIIRLIGDKILAGQAGVVQGENVSSFDLPADGLYIIGAYSNEYKTWLTEKNFWVRITTKGGSYSTKDKELLKDKNGNFQFFVWLKGGLAPEAYKQP